MDGEPHPGRRIPEPTLRRLAGYYRYFRDLQTRGARSISCSTIGLDLALDPTLVRKDLESMAIVGRRRVGFSVADLIAGIERRLGYNGAQRTVLAGAGTLGAALLKHWQLRQYGIEIIAAFDVAPSRVGKRLSGVPVRHIDDLAEVAREFQPQFGIITVPVDAAQDVAARLVANGVGAIWNFAPVNLRLPPHVIVQNEDLYRSLATLSYRLVIRQGELVSPPA
jgi:redox-sensing transcriptional repressor